MIHAICLAALAASKLAASCANWISLRRPNRMGKDGLDMDTWPTSSWIQLNAHPSVLLHRWDYVLCITYAVDNSSTDLRDFEVEY